MGSLRQEIATDRRIDEQEVSLIKQHLDSDGQLDQSDLEFLVELYTSPIEKCQGFEDLFFRTMKEVILKDGCIGPSEHFYLLKMLYSDGQVRKREKDFLQELSQEATEVSPEFETLCQQAFDAPSAGWST